LRKDYSHIDIYRGSGGDSDHFLGNLSVAKKYHKVIYMRFLDPNQSYFFLEHDSLIEDAKGRTVSIMPSPIAGNVRSEGLEYELDRETLKLGRNMGLRNRAVKDRVHIQYSYGCALMFVSNR